jgi:hypothetical protein
VVIGHGSTTRLLSQDEVRALCGAALAGLDTAGRRVLAIVPDNTRSGPVDLMFRLARGPSRAAKHPCQRHRTGVLLHRPEPLSPVRQGDGCPERARE